MSQLRQPWSRQYIHALFTLATTYVTQPLSFLQAIHLGFHDLKAKTPHSAVCCSQKTVLSAQCCLLLSEDSTLRAVLSAALRRQHSPRSAVCCSQKTVLSTQCCLLLSEDSILRAVLSAALRRQYSPRSAVSCSQKTVLFASHFLTVNSVDLQTQREF